MKMLSAFLCKVGILIATVSVLITPSIAALEERGINTSYTANFQAKLVR
jgi:hypothetical protein